jgi:hypothetical protein
MVESRDLTARFEELSNKLQPIVESECVAASMVHCLLF